MRALVVFESSFGNTKKIAESIADGLGPGVTVTVARADQLGATDREGVDLLVVGAPTQAWGLPRQNTRKGAVQQAPGVASTATTGVREWLATLRRVPSGTAAAFDTRFAKPRWVTGSAARGVAARLARLGYRVVATESFFVTGTQGPLRDGETERARAWAARLAATLTSARG